MIVYSTAILLVVLFGIIAYQYYTIREGFTVTPTTAELRSMVQGSLNGNVDSYTALVNTGLLTKFNGPANALNTAIKGILNGNTSSFLELSSMFPKFNDTDTVTGLTNILLDTTPSTTPSLTSSSTPATTPSLTLPVSVSGPVLTAPTALSALSASVSPQAAVAQEKQDQSKLLRDIQEVVHNEMLLTKQATTASSQPLLQGADADEVDDQYDSEATVPVKKSKLSAAEEQGREMGVSQRRRNCPNDMNDYVKKDNIPCWGCTLDY
jgi:hypothetical protein